MEKMKVFEINTQGEKDTVCVDGGVLEAIKFYFYETGCDLSEIDSVVEIPQEQWKTKTIFYDEMKEPITVDDYMKGHTWNEIIASTAY